MAHAAALQVPSAIQLEAAMHLSNFLDCPDPKNPQDKVPHAYTGGFACAVLGSMRPTEMSNRWRLLNTPD